MSNWVVPGFLKDARSKRVDHVTPRHLDLTLSAFLHQSSMTFMYGVFFGEQDRSSKWGMLYHQSEYRLSRPLARCYVIIPIEAPRRRQPVPEIREIFPNWPRKCKIQISPQRLRRSSLIPSIGEINPT